MSDDSRGAAHRGDGCARDVAHRGAAASGDTATGTRKLNFEDFLEFVMKHEDGKHTRKGLQARFDSLDADQSGLVDMREYLRFSMLEAMARLVTSSVTSDSYCATLRTQVMCALCRRCGMCAPMPS